MGLKQGLYNFIRVMLSLCICVLCICVNAAAAKDKAYVKVTVADPFIELRTGPGRGYPIFYIAERGETVEILKQRTDWFKVHTLRDKKGWVHIDQMAKTLDQRGEPLAVNKGTFEEFTERRWETGILLGDFGGTDAISAYGGFHFTRNLSLEAEVTETFGEFSNGRAAALSLVHQPFPKWRYSPFFTLGAGVRETEPKSTLVSTEDRRDDTLNVGLGVRVYLTRHFMLRVQYKRYTVLTNRDDDEEVDEWKIGLSTFF